MSEFFENMVMNTFLFICFGSWAIGTLLKKNPAVKDAAARGAAGLVTRFFTSFFR